MALMAKKTEPNRIDVHVGGRLRQLRNYKGLTQEQLATSVGVTFQQVQKYERGTNRVGASRLYDFSKVLNVPVASFFEGAEKTVISSGLGVAENNDNSSATFGDGDPFQKKETVQLVRAYYKISDPALRRKVLELAEILATSGTQGDV